jgi:hypothetical protein
MIISQVLLPPFMTTNAIQYVCTVHEDSVFDESRVAEALPATEFLVRGVKAGGNNRDFRMRKLRQVEVLFPRRLGEGLAMILVKLAVQNCEPIRATQKSNCK